MAPVTLYVYDLSRGMAKSMSLALTGKQLDGIWHTSIVVFNREIFFGQGILESRPGATHHGQPVQILDMGETEIDHATFNEYLASLAELYTAEAYHLMDFNCNHFTADLVGFLTGREIPTWISGLPAEFLSTPFGQMLRPQIDQMFRSRSSSEHRVNPGVGISTPATATPPISRTATPSTPLANGSHRPPAPAASSLLSSVATAATAGPSTNPRAQQSRPVASPLSLVTSSANFSSILSSSSAVIVNFTNTATCAPCRAIKPAYESLAHDRAIAYAPKGVRFLEVELGVGEGRDIAGRYGVAATPTFMFFRAGKKVDEMKGATSRELQARVDAFLEDSFPSHRHRKAYLPTIEGLPVDAMRSTGIPNYVALAGKLEGFAPTGDGKANVSLLKDRVIPLLEGKIGGDSERKEIYRIWVGATAGLLGSLRPEETFPVIDLWRMGLLQPAISALIVSALSPANNGTQPVPEAISGIVSLATKTLQSTGVETPRPFLLTTLRLLTNLLANLPLANIILSPSTPATPGIEALRSGVISTLVDSLLHPDTPVRSAAAGVALNIANHRHRLSKSTGIAAEETGDTEWEVEVLSALIEAVGKEEDEDVAYKLLAALAQLCYLSPVYEEGLAPLVEVLEGKKVVMDRMRGWKRKEVRKLAEEVVGKLW